MADKPVVLITERIAEAGMQTLSPECQICAPWQEGRLPDDNDLAVADGLIVRLFKVTEAVLAAAPKLKVIGRHGVGVDSVDLTTATKRGIPVVFTPSALTMANAVAEHTVQLMLALARQSVAADRMVREGRFDDRKTLIGIELSGKTLGIVGLGVIGAKIAEICRNGFNMQVLAFDPYRSPQAGESTVTLVGSLRELLEQSDVVSLHVPATPETHHLINAETLGHMRPSAMLVNAARGSVVDTVALAEALRRGHLHGAALDVFEQEPPPIDHPILAAPRTLFTPHVASSTGGSLERMAEVVARQVLLTLKGERPEFVANPTVFERAPAP
jgi:D-3-phosphoglycerate dehydrogenase / 2-oxoglutarate reductase